MKTYLERISDLHVKSFEQGIEPQAIRMTPSQVAGLEKELAHLCLRDGLKYPNEVMGLRIILDEREVLDLTVQPPLLFTEIMMKETNRERSLKNIVNDLLWMAARYAHGRHSYAPGMVRTAIKDMKLLFPDWEPREDVVIEAPSADQVGGISFRSDYLDDIFNPTSK